MSFVIPFGNRGNQCYNDITPHDMYSSLNCALSGAFLLGGGWCVVMWGRCPSSTVDMAQADSPLALLVFLRTLSLHLQICWQVVPGRKFFLSAQALGWSVPVVFLAIALSLTGVSFRFGESCHINSRNGVQTFWGPMLAMAAASIVTQSITFVSRPRPPISPCADPGTALATSAKSTSAACLRTSRRPPR